MNLLHLLLKLAFFVCLDHELFECCYCILEYSGPPDPLHGSAPYISVRQEAKVKKLLSAFSASFTTDNNIIFTCIFM